MAVLPSPCAEGALIAREIRRKGKKGKEKEKKRKRKVK
jgi:hypothetical protein